MIKPYCSGCPSGLALDTPNILDGEKFADFYISFFNGHIDVGNIGEKPFLSFHHDTPIPINSVGIKSPTSNATWEFYSQSKYVFREERE